jgi:hypothetical protein
MSHLIKLRAWDKETKEMDYNYLSKNWLKVCIESPFVELMQYTGLNDKNGKEIYEDDIVVVNDDNTEYGKMVWDNEESEYGIDIGSVKLKLGCYYSRDIEVIGNIHENSELSQGVN